MVLVDVEPRLSTVGVAKETKTLNWNQAAQPWETWKQKKKLREENHNMQFKTNCHDNVMQQESVFCFSADRVLTHMAI